MNKELEVEAEYFDPAEIKAFAAHAYGLQDTEDETIRVLLAERVYLLGLIRSFLDRDDCDYDHNRSCQMHGYYYLETGQLCPQDEAKYMLRQNNIDV